MRRTIRAATTAMLVGATIGVLGAAPAAAGGGGGCGQGQTEGTGTAVAITSACFTPSVLRITPGSTVTWTNNDPITHVVTGVGWGSLDDILSGGTTEHRFEKAGAYPYSCYLHPGMNGVVLVGDATLSDAGDGSTAALAATSTPDSRNDRTSPLPLLLAGIVGGAVGFGLAHRRTIVARIRHE